MGAGWGVVDDANGDVSIAAFAEAVGYCELEDEVGVGGDFGGGEGGLSYLGFAELYRIAAAVDLQP